ncbi:MAG: cytochrome c [Nitrospinae bacterium]|nr:cytochrome c [Nitrospinota bacterium]
MKKTLVAIALLLATAPPALAAPADPDTSIAVEGKRLYASQKFGCHRCHGPTGAEGGMGPSFTGIGKKYDQTALMERAAHNCPPTGACDPKQLGAIVAYLRTL